MCADSAIPSRETRAEIVGRLERLPLEIALEPNAVGLAMPLNNAPPALAKRSDFRWEGEGGAGDEDWSSMGGERSVSWLRRCFWATSTRWCFGGNRASF